MAGMQQTWWKKTSIRHENKRKTSKNGRNRQFHKNIAVKNHILRLKHNTEDEIIK